jgi:hypothetical protein
MVTHVGPCIFFFHVSNNLKFNLFLRKSLIFFSNNKGHAKGSREEMGRHSVVIIKTARQTRDFGLVYEQTQMSNGDASQDIIFILVPSSAS